MALILHHSDDKPVHMDTIATCGSQFWQWITSDWSEVDCPACLEKRPTMLAADLPKAAQNPEVQNESAGG